MDSKDMERTVTVKFTFNTYGKPPQIADTVDHVLRVLELAGLDVRTTSYSYIDGVADEVST